MNNLEPHKNNVDITFFVPCFNEEGNILNTLNEITLAVNETSLSWEIIVVDDKSIDSTREVVKNYIQKTDSQNIFLKENEVNLGLGRGYVDTSFISNGEYYILINGDNAEPKNTILAILEHVGGADMIIPYFGNQDVRSFGRVYASKLFTFLINLISGYRINYYNGPVVHKRFNVMRWSPDTHGFAYQAEIIVKVLDEKGTYKQVKIQNIDRKEGSSKAFTLVNIFSVTHSILQIFLRRVRTLLFYKNM